MFRRDSSPGGQRWSALWNGIIIGLGVGNLPIYLPFGVVFILVGVGLEYWQRKRLRKEGE
ncbi:MAG: hypothetical protein HYY31_04050 [Chloroflexi bacterium]|nr:hypothetical protein [Chloroflexota bacterium]